MINTNAKQLKITFKNVYIFAVNIGKMECPLFMLHKFHKALNLLPKKFCTSYSDKFTAIETEWMNILFTLSWRQFLRKDKNYSLCIMHYVNYMRLSAILFQSATICCLYNQLKTSQLTCRRKTDKIKLYKSKSTISLLFGA